METEALGVSERTEPQIYAKGEDDGKTRNTGRERRKGYSVENARAKAVAV